MFEAADAMRLRGLGVAAGDRVERTDQEEAALEELVSRLTRQSCRLSVENHRLQNAVVEGEGRERAAAEECALARRRVKVLEERLRERACGRGVLVLCGMVAGLVLAMVVWMAAV